MKIEKTSLKQLAVAAPPMLAEAIGYPGHARYITFYWTPCGDEVIYSDGRISADGHWPAWLLFVRHNSIAPHLEAYNLGSSDEEATHWLLVDCENCEMYVGTPGEISFVLKGQFASQVEAAELPEGEQTGAVTLEEFRSFMESFVEVLGPRPEEIIEAMRKQAALTEELQVWLDTKPSSESS
jgi:hypothetical protein